MRTSRNEKSDSAGPWAGNFAAAASIIGCTVTQLKAAKKSGRDGFRHGRVNVPAMKEWLKENAYSHRYDNSCQPSKYSP